jgi:5-carboxymethyl-2-hydroxymuconate isomerase
MEHIKSKKQGFDTVLIANHIEKASFLHCEVALFVGRPATVLNRLQQDLLRILRESAFRCPLPCWISVELREIPTSGLVAEIVHPEQ